MKGLVGLQWIVRQPSLVVPRGEMAWLLRAVMWPNSQNYEEARGIAVDGPPAFACRSQGAEAQSWNVALPGWLTC